MFENNKLGKMVFEDDYFLVLDKEPGINSVAISPLICHRLDKNTSGLLIIAKNKSIKKKIQEQFKKRAVKKKYLVLVLGRLEGKEMNEGFIFRNRKDKSKRKFISSFNINNFKISGKEHERYSKTKFQGKKIYFLKIFKKESQKELNYFSLIEAWPKTGRTHQIRLHLQSLHHPILGDNLYGGKIMKKINIKLNIPRLLLHALEISFYHPKTNKTIKIVSKIPSDFIQILRKLEPCLVIKGEKNER